jgi:hypothetical protein
MNLEKREKKTVRIVGYLNNILKAFGPFLFECSLGRGDEAMHPPRPHSEESLK